MATEVVLDTSYLLAWHRENDRFHEKASKIQAALTLAGSVPYVLDCVYSEMIAVIARTRVGLATRHTYRLLTAPSDLAVSQRRSRWSHCTLPGAGRQ